MFNERRNAEQLYIAFFSKVARMRKTTSLTRFPGHTIMPPFTVWASDGTGLRGQAHGSVNDFEKRKLSGISGSSFGSVPTIFITQNLFQI